MWMLSRKYVEQWLVWVVVDIVSAGLYIYKGIYFYAALYALYAVVAIFGYINWKKMMHAND
jgi:nicotinamide mononucleotide transporter